MSENKQRESGYYWVLIWGNWHVASYCSDVRRWEIRGISGAYADSKFQEINETKLNPPA